MKFDCKNLLIVDEAFGCSVTFSEKNGGGIDQQNMTLNELIKYSGKYLMLQRTYAKSNSENDQIEEDYLYIETEDPNKSGELTNFIVNVSPTNISIAYNKDLIEIQLNLDEPSFEKLKQLIRKIADKNGQVNYLN